MSAVQSSSREVALHGGMLEALARMYRRGLHPPEAPETPPRPQPEAPKPGPHPHSGHNLHAQTQALPHDNPPEPQPDPPLREIHCHFCGASHRVAHDVQSTTCPGCGRLILLSDVIISDSVSRVVDTRGHLRIEKNASLYSPLSVCGSAEVLGLLAGALHCEGKLEIFTKGSLPARIVAEELLIHSGAEVFCPYPVYVRRAVIKGVLRAPLLARGAVEVLRRGGLEGRLIALSLIVQRGAWQSGWTHIGKDAPEAAAAPLAPVDDFRQLSPRHAPRRQKRLPTYGPVLPVPAPHLPSTNGHP